MKPLGLGEHGAVTTVREDGRWVAYVRYRDYLGRQRRIKRRGGSRAEASRRVMKALRETLAGAAGVDDFPPSSLLEAGVRTWLDGFAAQVARGARSPSTLDLYRNVTDRLVIPGVGGLRLAEVTVPNLDRFVQSVLTEHGYATAKLCRSVLSGVCGFLVRRGGLPANPVRDLTPLEVDHDRTARAMTPEEVRAWLTVLDESEFARRWDLPDLTRFMLATGLRLGEALGVTWADVDFAAGTVTVERTIIRVQGQGLVAKGVKSRASVRTLVLPGWGVQLLRSRRARMDRATGPVFPDTRGGWRDRSNVGRAFRQVRRGTEFEWVKTHTYRKTVATLLDQSGATARMIADQLGHSRVSMTQDMYLGRRAVNAVAASALEAHGTEGQLVLELDQEESA